MADGFKPSDGQQIKISLVLRNAQNAIIYGDTAFVDWRAMADPRPFSITVYDRRSMCLTICMRKSGS